MPRRLTDTKSHEYLNTAEAAIAAARLCVADFHRRARYEARDGYPARGDGAGGGSDISDPTASNALAAPMIDHVARDIERFDWLIGAIGKHCEELNNTRLRILQKSEEERGRQSSVRACECCLETVTGVDNDRIRTGFCRHCYTAWLNYRDYINNERHESASRYVFIEQRRRELADAHQEAS